MSDNKQDQATLPVLVNPPESRSKSPATKTEKDEKAAQKKSSQQKASWLGLLIGRGKGSDFITSTSLHGIVTRKKNLINATVLFLAVDVVLISVFIFVWANR